MQNSEKMPQIIQGGMGIGVSNWRLAKAVANQGQMGVVSGTALDAVVARRLQLGSPKGNMLRALSHFPWPEMVQRVLEAYFIPGGKTSQQPFKLARKPSLRLERASIELLIVANFVEVFLAREGHHGPVGINYLEKIQFPTLPSLLGAMLAGVDYILMGAGIPAAIPGILDRLASWEPVELSIHAEENVRQQSYIQQFDPREICPGARPTLSRPKFLAIVSSDIVAKSLVRKVKGAVDGFIVENYTAGGHNAPPRKAGKSQEDEASQFGPKDVPDIGKIQELRKPFWLAGGYAHPDRLREALEAGANGIQVGTAFAFCDESAIMPHLKEEVLRQYLAGQLQVYTDFEASPTGYPFKLVVLPDTVTDLGKSKVRKRVCDMGFLHRLYCHSDNGVGYRCASEPVKSYLAKGGREVDTLGKHCLCNGLLATIGLGQLRENGVELPMVTAGEDFSFMPHLIHGAKLHYTAKDVIRYLTSKP
jgi:nitronate monooxygenase